MTQSPVAEQLNPKPGQAAAVCARERAEDLARMRSFWTAQECHPNNDLDYFLLIAQARKEVVVPLVLTVEKDGEIEASLAGRVEETRQRFEIGYAKLGSVAVRKLAFVTAGALGDLSAENARLFVEWTRAGLKKRGLDFAVLHNQPLDSALVREAETTVPGLLRAHGGRAREHWRLSLPADYNDFLARRKNRRHLNRLPRILERDFPGQVKTKIFDQPEDVEQFCRDAEAVAAKTYQRRLGAGFSDIAETREYCRLLAARGALKGYILYIQEKPCAYWLGSMHREIFFLHTTGYDQEFRKYEVGTFLFLNLIRDACGTALRKVDFGLGTADYKERFCDENWLEKDCYIFAPTLRGVLLSVMISGGMYAEKVARWLASQTGPVGRIKRIWRQRLLAKNVPAAPENT